METPNSIYIFTDGDERWYDVKEWEGRTPPPANVEYIRKDALMEWVNKKLQESADRLDFHANQAYVEVIDKLNSL